jgi:bacillolysin
MRSRSFLAISAAAVLAATTTVVAAGTSSAIAPPVTQQGLAGAPAGSFAFSGNAAQRFVLPADMTQLHSTTFPDGRTQTRYQQVVKGASVVGGQITVVESAAGQPESVIGAYFPQLQPKNKVKVSKKEARQEFASEAGAGGDFDNSLRLDPRTGRLFYQVESIRRDARPVRWIDATSGETIKAFDALTEGEGIGVKGDRKTIDTTVDPKSGLYQMVSADGRQLTADVQNELVAPVIMKDEDDVWDLPGNESPSQPAGVDAHYYANVVDDFYQDVFGRDSIDDEGMQIRSFVHFGENYCNAFWNGAYMTYGDGNGTTCKSLSGGLDVDGHELTHGVTDFTSNLIYENESGALNEAFSDMMGNTIEFYADDNGLDKAAEPDWLIGEDVINTPGDATPGFRNMGDPKQDGDPSHVSQAYTGDEDNGGVHTNSGIPNHAYYLTVNGGKNASCTANEYHDVLLTGKDCQVTVPAVGLDRATQVYYEAFTGLTEYANFCDARNATLAVAKGVSKADKDKTWKAVEAAWDAVGVHNGCSEGTPPPPPCESNPSATLPIESPHPYGNNGDCTWTYDNGEAGFAFHFSLLNTEAGYDYVYIRDADGNVVATYDGDVTAAGPVTTPCIPTSTGSIRLVSDAGVTAPGFTADAVEPC